MEPDLAAGIEAFNRGDFSEAARLFRRGARRRGAAPETSLFLAQSLRSLGKLPAATACLKKLIAARPDYGPGYRGLAEILQARGKLEEAVDWARRGSRKNPRDAQTRAVEQGVRRELSWARRKRALVDQRAGRWDAAERWLLKALEVIDEKEVRDELRKVRGERAEKAREAERRARREAELARREKEERAAALAALAKARRESARAARKAPAKPRVEPARAPSMVPARPPREEPAVVAKAPAPPPPPPKLDRAAEKARELFASGRKREAADWASRALARERAKLDAIDDPAERLRALARLGRYEEACALGESFFDDGPTLDQARAFSNPWGWMPRELFMAEHAKMLDALIARGRFAPLATYFLATLRGWAGKATLERLAALPQDRYGWMAPWVGRQLLCAGLPEDAVRVARAGLDYSPSDWSSRFGFIEALICVGAEEEALAQSARAAGAAPAKDRGWALSCRGEISLWLGRYEEAFETLGEACAAGFAAAWGRRGAAALQLGRLEEGLALLDESLRRRPGDPEARVWRGEALRRLVKHEEALRELALAPSGVWRSVNAGLAKAALGDQAGLREEYARLPGPVVDFVKGKLDLEAVESAEDLGRVLRKALELARGFRREDYNQLVWARPSEAARDRSTA